MGVLMRDFRVYNRGIMCLQLMLVVYPAASPLKVKMSAPAVIDYRDDMKLDCQFDMGGEQLYAVKWYKDDHEFFRYGPKQEPHKITFPVYGVRLLSGGTECDHTRCKVILTNLLRTKSGGAFRCEVSTEAPAFRLASQTQNVTVAAVPKGGPVIQEISDTYFEGEIVTAKCVSAPSDPPQLITWFINNNEAPSKFLRDLKTSKADANGLVSTSQIIRFAIERNYTENKYVELSCVAAFDGTPASARRVTAIAAVYGHDTHFNNPSYTYWHTSQAQPKSVPLDYVSACLLMFLSVILANR